MPDISVGGATLSLPDGASDEVVQKAITDFRSSPEFDHLVDKASGAPARVRMLVDGSPQQDRLANLRKFYPDAINYDNENFVYTDQRTGRPTLYNPSGMDMGDVAGSTRIGAQVLGSGVGAVMGAAAGPFGAIGGSALGASAGAQLYDIASKYLGGTEDTRTLGQHLQDAGLDAAAGAAGEAGGMLLSKGAKAVLGGGSRAVRATADAFKKLDVAPPASAISRSWLVKAADSALGNVPASATIMQRQRETVLEGIQQAADRITAKFGTPLTKQGAGEVVQKAAAANAERFGFTQEGLYNKAYDLVGKDTPVTIPNVMALRTQMEGELARAPASLAKALEPAIKQLDQLVSDSSQAGGLPFDAFRQIRTMVGKDIASPMLAGSTGPQQEALKRVYGALTQDMSAIAKATSPDAADALSRADAYTRAWMQNASKSLQKIVDFDAPEKAFQYVMSQAPDGGSRLMFLRRRFKPEEWDAVASSVLGRLGEATPGAQNAAGDAFSPATFLTNWSKMSPEAKGALFGGSRYAKIAPELDSLVTAIGALKEVGRLANTSHTATHLLMAQTFSSLGLLGAAAATGVGMGTATGVISGTIVAPYFAAKLLTSPRFVAWLIEPAAAKGALAVGTHIGRLAAIAEAEPELQSAISAYTQVLRNSGAPSPQSSREPATPHVKEVAAR